MAGPASSKRPVPLARFHEFRELAMVGVAVACRAGPVFKVIFHRSGDGTCLLHCVAFIARNRNVRTPERERCSVVFSEGELSGAEPFYGVAILTLTFVRGARKLPFVDVRVAGAATGVLNRENCIRAPRNVAPCARNGSVPAFERIPGLCMLFDGEGGCLESLDRVAKRAIGAEPALRELPVVGIRNVAIDALMEGDGCFEVSRPVTPFASDLPMASPERKRSFRMVEALDCTNLPPRHRVMAGLAGIMKHAMVGIGMAVGTLREGNPYVLDVRLRSRQGRMALFASEAGVRAGQRELRFGMIEFGRGFPARFGVATCAIRTQLPAVFVRVAAHAFPREAKKRAVQILDDNPLSPVQRNILFVVACIASQTGVASDERIPGFRMVELSPARLPTN